MAIGRCQWMTCQSLIGSSFRARFSFLGLSYCQDAEVLLCPDHTRIAESLREIVGELRLTPEGVVYGRTMMDALGFVT